MKKPLSRQELRKFGLVTGAMLVLFFDVLIPWIWDFPPPRWPLIAAAVLAVPALLYPLALRPVYRGWMFFAEILGWINTRIILGVVFYLVFLPLGLAMRAMRDPMRREYDASAESYRIDSAPPKPENMSRPY